MTRAVVARAGGASMAAVAEMVGVSLNSVSRALRGDDPLRLAVPAGIEEAGNCQGGLVPLARPEPREAERQAARAGLLEGAAPVFANAGSVAWAGALFLLPGVVAGGLIAAVEKIYGEARRACFYGLSSLFLTVVFSVASASPGRRG